jgi:hypothetical protein
MATALGGEQWWGGFRGRGRGEAARVGGDAFMAQWWRQRGAGRSGTAGWPAAGGGRRRGWPEVEGAPDMWVPHVRERKRGDRRRVTAGRVGRKMAGPRGWAGVVLFFFSFLFFNPFQIFSNLSFISFQIKF